MKPTNHSITQLSTGWHQLISNVNAFLNSWLTFRVQNGQKGTEDVTTPAFRKARSRTHPCFPKGFHPQETSLSCSPASQGRFQASWTLGKTAIADKHKITMGCSLTLWIIQGLASGYGSDRGLSMHLHSSSGNTQLIHCGEHKQKPPVHRIGWRWWDRRGSPRQRMHLRYIYN